MEDKKFEVLNQYPIQSWEFPRVLVCPLIERTISYADLVFTQMMQIAAQGPVMLNMPYMRTDLARNKAGIELLKSNFTHLLMLDIDHVHPVDIVQRLCKWPLIDSKKFQVVGGMNFRRSSPFDPCAYKVDEDGAVYAIEWDENAELVEVDRLGTGSILIAREVFEKLELPWFFNIYDQAWNDSWPGEDIGFSRKCKEAGIQMWCDTTVTSPHIAPKLITEKSWRKYIEDHPEDVKSKIMDLNGVKTK